MDTSSVSAPAAATTSAAVVDEATKKDRALAEFMLMLDDYEPLVCLPLSLAEILLDRQ